MPVKYSFLTCACGFCLRNFSTPKKLSFPRTTADPETKSELETEQRDGS